MKNFLTPLALLFWGAIQGCTSMNDTPSVLDLPVPYSYSAEYTSTSIQVDGLAREKAWDQVKWSSLFTDIQGETKDQPYYDTRFKMLWDEEFLYVYAEMEEEHVWGDITERDAVIFHNNDFEIFIKPNERQPFYAEFEANALGTLWELFLTRPYRRNGPVLDQWDVNDLELGIDIQGTLNEPNDLDKKWSTEWAIPIKAINDIDRGHKFGAGSMWRINFSRVQWEHQVNNGRYQRRTDSQGRLLPEYNWVWSPQYAIDMHRPEHWGYLHFVNNGLDSKATDRSDVLPRDAYQLLYYLYRAQLDWKAKHDAFTDDIGQLGGPAFLVNEIAFSASVQLTRIGFEISVTTADGNTLTINQNEFITLSP